MEIPINMVDVGERARAASPDYVQNLADSIREVGLLQPIVVGKQGERYKLIAGLHRLEAARLLGWETIPAQVLHLDSLHARIAEIDENLIRNELTALQRAELMAERKRLYEQLNPLAKPEVQRLKGLKPFKSRASDDTVSSQEHVTAISTECQKGQIPRVPTFTEEASVKLGVSQRSVQRDLFVAENLASDVKEALRDTPIADSVRDLVLIARMPEEQQRQIAKVVAESGAQTLRDAKRELRRRAVEDARRQIAESPPPQPEGLFDVIVIDPPWAYGTEYDPETRRVASPYPEMSLEEIRAIALPTAPDCVLFLWTTHRFLRDAFDLLEHWGFIYKATLVWDKEVMGIGQTLRMQCEFCLIGFKGKPLWHNTRWRDIIREPRTEHSRKPEIFYRLVEECTAPSARRLDYFARRKRDGWVCYGNEVI